MMDKVQPLKRDTRLSKTLLNSCVFLPVGKAYGEILLAAKFMRYKRRLITWKEFYTKGVIKKLALRRLFFILSNSVRGFLVLNPEKEF
jgi:hypothetical protein